MSVLSADFNKAIMRAWDAAFLDNEFKAYWATADRTEFPVLHDEKAGPAQPFPYCVFQESPRSTKNRMTAQNGRNEIHECQWEFRVQARSIGNTSAKQIAATLAELVIKAFGGHPTFAPQELTLDNGGVISTTYVSDFGIREDDNVFQWHIKYKFVIDVPMLA